MYKFYRSFILSALFFLVAQATNAQVVFSVGSAPSVCGAPKTVVLPIKVSPLTNIGSFQFTLAYDVTKFTFGGVSALSTAFGSGNVVSGFDTTGISSSGQIAFFWSRPGMPINTSLDSTVFSITLNYLGGSLGSVAIVPNGILPFKITDGQGFEIIATQSSGTVGSIDSERPVVICPVNKTVTSSLPTKVGMIGLVSAADNCGILDTTYFASVPSNQFGVGGNAGTSTSAPTGGVSFAIGTTVVTYTVRDKSNNTGTCSFNVTVVMPPAPPDTLTFGLSGAPYVCDTGLYYVDVIADHFDSIGSMQFMISWNKNILKFDTIANFSPSLGLNLSNFTSKLQAINQGRVALIWSAQNPNSRTLADGTPMFRVYFRILQTGTVNTPIIFNNAFFATMASQSNTGTPSIPVKTVNLVLATSDKIQPVINCPANVNVDLPVGQTMVQVNNLVATYSDNCDLTPNVSYSVFRDTVKIDAIANSADASGMYGLGLTAVCFRVIDDAGNNVDCCTNIQVNPTNTVRFSIDSVLLNCKYELDYVDVPVRVRNFVGIQSLQYTIGWNPTILTLDTVLLAPVLAANLGALGTSMPGTLTYFNPLVNGAAIANDSVLMTLRFNIGSGNFTSPVAFSGSFSASSTSMQLNTVRFAGEVKKADVNAPKITNCPKDTVLNTSGSGCTATITWPPIISTDDCGSIMSLDSNFLGNTFFAGSNLVRYIARDSAGNTDTCAFTILVKDVSGPAFVIGCPSPIVVSTGTLCTGTGTATWTVPTGRDACDQTTMNATSTFTPGQIFAAGQTTVSYTVTDLSGNQSTCVFTVTVKETINPTITCPMDRTISLAAAKCDSIVTWSPATATDNCGAVVITSNIASGSLLPSGNNTITYTATDSSGNTATCSFSVRLLEVTAPVIKCPDTLIVATDSSNTSMCGASVMLALATATDNCGAATIKSDSLSGSYFKVGTTVVTYTATDLSGNTATCSAVVRVRDLTKPIFTYCPNDQILTLSPVTCARQISWIAPTVADVKDLCGVDITKFTASAASPKVFGVGKHVISFIGFDLAGNSATCSFLVTIRDTVPPRLATCPKDSVITNLVGCSAPFNFALPIATDNCATMPIPVATPPSGSIVTKGSNTIFKILVKDDFNNVDSCSFTVSVSGAAGTPTIACPSPIQQVACSYVGQWPQPTVSGFCDSIVSLMVAPYDTGSVIPLGVNVLTYTAKDASGGTATCSFSVTVSDPIPPTVSCPDVVVVDVAGGIINDAKSFLVTAKPTAACDSVIITHSGPVSSDNCGAVTVVQSIGPRSGATLGVGTSVMSFSIIDAAGNVSNCSFNLMVDSLSSSVLIQASRNPVCAGDSVVISAPSFAGATYDWSGPASSYPKTASLFISPVSQAAAGNYSVKITNGGCSFVSDTLKLSVGSFPNAENDLVSLQVGELDTLRFLANDMTNNLVSVVLVNPILGASLYQDSFIIFSGASVVGIDSFQYKVCSVVCPNLCDIATVRVDVKDSPCVYEPNIITPNGDDLNDEWVIPCLEFDKYPNNSVVIYNQWGDKVFEASPYKPFPKSTAWNGGLNNDLARQVPDGVYYYVFKPSPTASPRKGFIEVYR
jgi:gliding motility-associated-like protein